MREATAWSVRSEMTAGNGMKETTSVPIVQFEQTARSVPTVPPAQSGMIAGPAQSEMTVPPAQSGMTVGLARNEMTGETVPTVRYVQTVATDRRRDATIMIEGIAMKVKGQITGIRKMAARIAIARKVIAVTRESAAIVRRNRGTGLSRKSIK